MGAVFCEGFNGARESVTTCIEWQGRRHGFFSVRKNRRQLANLPQNTLPTPKYPKNRKNTGFGPFYYRIRRGRPLLNLSLRRMRPSVSPAFDAHVESYIIGKPAFWCTCSQIIVFHFFTVSSKNLTVFRIFSALIGWNHHDFTIQLKMPQLIRIISKTVQKRFLNSESGFSVKHDI